MSIDVLNQKGSNLRRRIDFSNKNKLFCKGFLLLKKHEKFPHKFGQKCNKLLAEANSKGELKCKVICPRCKTTNEVF